MDHNILTILPLFAITGIVSGLLAGMLGLGGGIIVVPILGEIFLYLQFPHSQIMHLCVGSSLAIMTLTTLMAAHKHYKKQNINLLAFRFLIPPLLIGTLIGTQLADILPTDTLRNLFAVFMLLVAISMLLPTPIHIEANFNLTKADCIKIGPLIGIIAGMLGVGGGVMMVPFLLNKGVTFRQAVGTSALATFFVAIMGTIGVFIAGFNAMHIIEYSYGYFYLPAIFLVSIFSVFSVPLGVKLVHSLDQRKLKLIFAILLILVSIRLIYLSIYS